MRRLLAALLLLGLALNPIPLAAADNDVSTINVDAVTHADGNRTPDSPSPSPMAPLATDYYVDAATGSNTPSGGTMGSPWKTITYALSQMAGTGLVLHVAAGAYNQALGETFPIMMKSGISVSGADSATTVISGVASAAVMRFVGTTAYASTTVLSGFTIMGGSEGVLIEGISGVGTAPTIRGNRIESNTYGIRTDAQNGKKVYARIEYNIISGNISHGVYNYSAHGVAEASPVLEQNLIIGNGGAGIYCYTTGSGMPYNNDYGVCSPTLIHNRIANNNSDGFTCFTYGAGRCSPRLDGNTIVRNSGWGFGHVVDISYLISSAPEFYNNIIAGNASGGGKFLFGSADCEYCDTPLFVNNTIAYNGPNGIIDGYPLIVNNIVWGQTSDLNAPADRVSYSDISQGIYAGLNNNVSVDPLFVNRFNDDYHLQLTSPVVDIGNCAYPNLSTADVDGDSRVVGSCVDMGADEASYWQNSQQIGDRSVAQPGQSIIYTVSITNASDSTRTGVVVTDTLDSHVSFTSASDGGTFSNGAVVWNGLTVTAHSTVALSLTVSVNTPLGDATDVANRVQILDNVPTLFNVPAFHTAVYNPAQAAFAATPTLGAVPLIVTFQNQSHHATQALWSYGDGITNTISTTHTHTYNSAGSYTVTLQVANPASSDTLTRTQYITTYHSALASFVGTPTVGPRPLTVTFTNNSLYADQFLWDYGDGSTSTTAATTHVHNYAAAGTYTVSLRAGSIYSSNIFTRTNYINVGAAELIFLPMMQR